MPDLEIQGSVGILKICETNLSQRSSLALGLFTPDTRGKLEAFNRFVEWLKYHRLKYHCGLWVKLRMARWTPASLWVSTLAFIVHYLSLRTSATLNVFVCFQSNGDCEELVSERQGPLKCAKLLPQPSQCKRMQAKSELG